MNIHLMGHSTCEAKCAYRATGSGWDYLLDKTGPCQMRFHFPSKPTMEEEH